MATVNLGTIEAILRLKDEMSKQMSRTAQTVGTSVSKLNTKFNEATAGLQRYAGPLGLAAVGAAALKLVNDVRTVGTELVDLRAKTGVSLQGLQELKFASEQVGVGFDQTTMAVVRMGRRLAAELPEATKWMDMLGLSTNEILEMEPAEGFQAIVEAIAEIENPAQQAAAAMGIFGDAGLQMLPLIRSDLDATIERFHALGGVIEDDVLESGKKLDDTMTDLSAAFGGATAELGGALIPAMQWLAEILTQLPLYVKLLAQGFVSTIATMIASVLEMASKIPIIGEQFQGVAEEVRSFATYYDEQATSTWLAIDALDAMQQGQTEAAGATKETTGALEEEKTTLEETAAVITTTMNPAVQAYVLSMDELTAHTETYIGSSSQFGDQLLGVIPQVAPEVEDIGEEFDEAGDSVSDMSQLLADMSHTFQVLGIDANSALGQIVGGFSAAMSAGQNFNAAMGERNFGGMAQAGAQGGMAVWDATGSGSRGARVAGGALSGAAMGAQIGGPIGAGIGAAAGAILGAFRGRAMMSLISDVSRDLGVQISEELATALEESGEPVQLAVAQIFEEGFATGDPGATADRLAEEMGDLFVGMQEGLFTEGEGIAALEEAMPLLLQHFGELGEVGEAQIERIIQAAREMGITFEGLNELIAAHMGPTLQDVAEQFGLTVAEARAMSELLGVKLPTQMQLLAAQMGSTPAAMRELGAAMEEQLGIPIERLQELLAVMGISLEEFAASLGVELPSGLAEGEAGAEGLAEGTGEAADNLGEAADQAGELADELERAANASDGIRIPGGDGGEGYLSAQSGYDSGVLTGTTLFPPILAHAGERLSVTDAGNEAINVTYSPRNSISIQQGTPQQMEGDILDSMIGWVRQDTKSIVGEITRKQQRS